jgi:hypothetical protein
LAPGFFYARNPTPHNSELYGHLCGIPCHLANLANLASSVHGMFHAADFFVVNFIRCGIVSWQLGLHRWQTVIC